MTINIQNAQDLTSPWTSWFIYGATGSGKTSICATFPQPFFIVPANEKSINTLQGMNVQYVEVGKRNDMYQVLDFLEGRYNDMLRLMSQGDDTAANVAFPWQTIVVESISHYSDLVIEDLSQGGTKQMDYQQWGKLGSHLRTIQMRLRALDVHSLFTSLDKVSDDGQHAGPLISGQMATKMPSACDYIVYCEAVGATMKDKPAVYRAHFRQFGKFPARVRQSPVSAKQHGAFPPMIDNFHFDKISKFLGITLTAQEG